MPCITHKILKDHLIGGGDLPAIGDEIEIKIDQTLTQDATGTMAYLELEALGIDRVRTELSVSYVDHQLLQADFKNPDDHEFLRTVAQKYGIIFSRPGNGICHQVHLERFARPGKTLIGSDSHTPTAGGVGGIAIGAGGLDVTLCMGGEPFRLNMPKVVGIKLTGQLNDFVSAKDVILQILRIKGKKNADHIFEYFGPGVSTLDVPSRATITNMGAEAGVTTSVFPSDEITREWLEQQQRGDQWVELKADSDNEYDEILEIDLSSIVPNVAMPFQPNNVKTIKEVRELKGDVKVHQVCIGSCTNSSYRDLMTLSRLLKGKTVHPEVCVAVFPGSKLILDTLARNGALTDLISAGCQIMQSGCGACIGMGYAPGSGQVSVRSFNRNFLGRCGHKNADVYLASPETCAACALTGMLTGADELGVEVPEIPPATYIINDNMLVEPPTSGSDIEIVRGPNIKPLCELRAPDDFELPVQLKVGDDISTDHIMPAGSKVLPFRSNIPEISKFCYGVVDESFHDRCLQTGGGIIVGGSNYGQGSSREHAAIAPLYLGIRVCLVKDFARIHKANLVNWGIVPLEFENADDYDLIDQGDVVKIDNLQQGIEEGVVIVKNVTKGKEIRALCQLGAKSKTILARGGNIMDYRVRNNIQ
eukprot:TRINITY_DN3250_c3_g1_i2.p1 TRINITY_DN3250_c3_g1~~TRINITY_DN3250_c3_g1_i2.p1  ORF type:complete len:647 (+),score=203.47 TRINITY_DN3250_c3_g1_i2:31-1971(+)